MKIVVILLGISAWLLLPVMANSQSYRSPASSGYQTEQSQRQLAYPRYDYQGHAQQNYQNARERYMQNPTSQNYNVMQQREQIMHMRERQYQGYGRGQ